MSTAPADSPTPDIAALATDAAVYVPESDPLRTTRTVGVGDEGYWVFEVDEDADLYSYYYPSYALARAHAEATDNRCQILCLTSVSVGSSGHTVRVEDFT